MARIKFAKGSRGTFEITAKDELEAALDLTGKKFGFVVFRQPNETLVRFAYPTIDDWKVLDVVNLAIGKFSITMDPEDTSSADPGNYDAEIIFFNTVGSKELISKNPGGKEFIELFDSPTSFISEL